MVAREMPRHCATLCRGPLGWHTILRHKVTRHKVSGTKLWRPATNTFRGHEQIMKMITVLCMQIIIISCVRGTVKTMKMITAPCISYDSEAGRQLPTHFQNHENADCPMHFL